MPGMGQRTQAAAGCLTAAVGAGAGLAVWAVDVRERLWRFEAAPDWSVLYAELPLAVLGGIAASLGAWALLRRLRPRR
ncbi:hypothetical protein AQJ43_26610 [Streptomyces avermitilis]|uniref:Uncharacterized protein n=2 Tax=Streptomyces TaxID=1883 RepID=A0A4D4MST9_STRAX|nr:hypothetical protein AQJ43_26610 [Streptomyces avermitilis]MYT00129.1 hypothetical protein [Streptomyces sp. SID5469]OOV31671.1 hypothetical protein SM007_01760 [Streptomyces avermitilis]BBJ52570.1 hypothetical protein SAVMC3_51990 [Streptomyces avermitilis]GDY64606.1 hypothetical protein SAV14893_039990 [Streptomyces avermitilis]